MQWKKNWNQFRLLMWKNLCLQRKLWRGTIMRIINPVVFGVMLIVLRLVVPSEFISGPTVFPSFSVNTRLVPPAGGNLWHLAYTPNTALTNRIVKRAAGLINAEIKADLAFDTEGDLIEHLRTANNVFGGIVFLFNSNTNLPRNITYKIRLRAEMNERSDPGWLTDHAYPSVPTIGPRQQDMYGGREPGYYHEGFLTLQQAVDLSIIKEVNRNFDVNRFQLRLKQYPYPPYNEDRFIRILDELLAAFIMISFLVTGRLLCKDILLEKEKQLKESMKLMGMKSWIYWCSWFFKSAITVTMSMVFLTTLLHIKTANGAMINYTSPLITFIFLLLYCLSLVSFVIAVSTLFSKAITGSFVMYIIFLATCLPYAFIDMNCGLARKLAMSLDFNLALGFGCRLISDFERIGVGLQFSNLAKPFGVDDSWTMLHVLGMLTVDIILYAIIAWYLDNVMPGDVGTSQPYYFPFMRSYWFGHYSAQVPENYDDDNYSYYYDQCSNGSMSGLLSSDREEHFEKPLVDAKSGIRIRGLTKKFESNATVAVNKLNIDIYEGYITALVGQNGAGKTTTMFMLTGFLPPTDGSAYINGMNIKYEMEKIRENLGLCPQHDILFDWLTVREHLVFFAKLKGCPSGEVDKKVSDMIEVLHLEDKANVDAIYLSGGLKRKLCVGIALIGDSKFVILDEPTSGMDPEARKQTWDILQSQQKGRTIILSTHYMDEADQLGDRIAIMAYGQIQCYGTPMFLKNKYGIGYHMTIIKNTNCDVDYLNEVIKKHVPNARLETSVGAEVSFVLPRDKSHKFEKLFARLEKDQQKLGVESFGVSVTTMEEVFLKVGQTAGSAIGLQLQDSSDISVLEGGQDSAFGIEIRNDAGSKQNYLPFLGLLAKRIICAVRSWILLLAVVMLPVSFILFTLRDLITFQEIKDPSPLYLNLSHFTNPITPFDVFQPSLQFGEAMKIANCYAEVAGIGGKVIYLNSKSEYNTMGSFLLSIATSSIEQYNAKYLTGATIEAGESPNGNMTITGWFNNAAYHAIAISLSQVTNTLMQCFGQKEYHIQTINHPLPWINKSQVNDDKRIAVERRIHLEISLPYALEIFICIFPICVITERITGSKHLQLVSGAKLFGFWFSTFVVDFIVFLIPTAVIIIILEGVNVSPYTEGSAMWFVLLDFIFYGFSVIPFIYVFSSFFQTTSTGCAVITNILVVSSAVSTYVPLIVGRYSLNAAKILQWVLYFILPNFCFEEAFRDFIPLSENHRACSRNQSISCLPEEQNNEMDQCCSATINYVAWEYPGIGRSLFFMALQSVVLFLILILIETSAISLLCKRSRAQLKAEIKNEEIELDNELAIPQDSDVLCERDRILNTPITNLSKSDLIIMQDLTKVFGDFIAVDMLSLGIPRGECFGLLGVNGAGKTTCFKILTRELKPSFGNAFRSGESVWGNGSKDFPYIGYCPQSDALLDQLTVRETVWIFALLRGIPNGKRNQVVNAMIDRLMLKDYTSKQTSTLSGGNKRKLSVAIALIGDPQIIFLDEPTTGMDPLTRRIVWNTLTAVRRTGRTLILTSHSMEECEAICTRIAIMANGRFQCLGSIQHLKAKFTEGYTLIIKKGGTSNTEEGQKKVNQIKSFVSSTFPGSILKDHHEGLLNYQIYTRNLRWSQIFGTIERAKHHLEIEDYSVSQTTLEQVFISFARMQRTRCNV